jgi:hypothetical protein
VPCLTANDDHGFHIDEAEVIYWGYCPACQTTSHHSLTTPLSPRSSTMSDNGNALEINDTPQRCPVMGGAQAPHTAVGSAANEHWWPNQLSLRMLHQHSPASSPLGGDFDYAEEFKSLDLAAVKPTSPH